MTLRSILEKSTRPLIIKRRLPKEFNHTPLFVSPTAGLRYLFSGMNKVDPSLLALVKEFVKDGHVVWDIGANIGLFSYAAASLAGKNGLIVSVEPDTWLVHLLRKSARIQNKSVAPLKVISAAVASNVAVRTFCLAVRSRSTNFLAGYGSTQTGGVLEEQTVITITLDWLLENLQTPPDILKIDVEGAETEALCGAQNLLRIHRPIVLCEVGSESQAEVTRILHENGYKLFDADTPAQHRQEVLEATWNTLGIPGERI